MTYDEAVRLRERACTRKQPISSRGEARRTAARMTETWFTRYEAYRCPFHGERDVHWHVGHAISLVGMQATADAIRVLAQGTDLPARPPLASA